MDDVRHTNCSDIRTRKFTVEIPKQIIHAQSQEVIKEINDMYIKKERSFNDVVLNDTSHDIYYEPKFYNPERTFNSVMSIDPSRKGLKEATNLTSFIKTSVLDKLSPDKFSPHFDDAIYLVEEEKEHSYDILLRRIAPENGSSNTLSPAAYLRLLNETIQYTECRIKKLELKCVEKGVPDDTTIPTLEILGVVIAEDDDIEDEFYRQRFLAMLKTQVERYIINLQRELDASVNDNTSKH